MRLADVRTADGRVRYVVVNGRGEIVEPVARYLKHLDQRGYARNTLRSYGQGLGYYFAYLEERRVDYGAAGVEHRAGFVHWLKLPPAPAESAAAGAGAGSRAHRAPRLPRLRANRTVNLYLGAVTGFYDYLWRTGQLAQDLNERLRGTARSRFRPYKGFLHHLGRLGGCHLSSSSEPACVAEGSSALRRPARRSLATAPYPADVRPLPNAEYVR